MSKNEQKMSEIILVLAIGLVAISGLFLGYVIGLDKGLEISKTQHGQIDPSVSENMGLKDSISVSIVRAG